MTASDFYIGMILLGLAITQSAWWLAPLGAIGAVVTVLDEMSRR